MLFIIRGSESGKTNILLNLTNYQHDIDKNYLEPKNPYEAKYQLLIIKNKSVGLKHYNDSKAFIEYSNDVNDIYKHIDKYNSNKKRKILMVFHGMIADILGNKTLQPIVTELFIRGKKLNISLVFIAQSYFSAPENLRLNAAHYFILKTSNKQEFHQIAINHSSNIEF